MTNGKGDPILASIKECTGCMACADACASKALKMVMNDDGHCYPEVNGEKCLHCHACEKVCPIRSGAVYSRNSGKSTPFAAWTTDKRLIKNSASGGVFAAMAFKILHDGGYVVGAISDGTAVKHIITNKVEDLPLLQGSKYLQSDMSGIYCRVKQLLKTGATVLFSGTGCQVGGLLQFLRKPYDNLYTVDLICAGVPSSLIMSRFCKEENVRPEIISWRDKEEGWQHGLQLTITSGGETRKWKTQNCFLGGGFLEGLTYRWACYNCRFAGTDRLSDFTIGDYWGCKEWREQWHDGVSVLVIHSSKGKSLVKQCSIESRLTSLADCSSSNPRLVIGKSPLAWSLFERRIISWAFHHLNYKTLKRLYAGEIERTDILWIPYKIFKRLRWKLSQCLMNHKIKSIKKTLYES